MTTVNAPMQTDIECMIDGLCDAQSYNSL